MKLLPLICVLAFLAADPGHARSVEGTVRAVYDGDTIQLATRSGSRLKVRLYGIDAPETAKPDRPGQPFGDAAERALFAKVMGRQVTADVIETDQYRRAVAVVHCSGRDVNRDMVAEGMAWAYRHFLQGPYASEYIGAENLARSRRLGLWRDPNPQPPWEFRQTLKGKRQHGRRHRQPA